MGVRPRHSPENAGEGGRDEGLRAVSAVSLELSLKDRVEIRTHVI